MSDSEAPLLCPVCLVSMGVQLSEECAELGEREETYILSTNLTSRGKKLLKLLIKKTRLIKIFEIYRDKIGFGELALPTSRVSQSGNAARRDSYSSFSPKNPI